MEVKGDAAFVGRYGPWALVAGGAAGIGAAYSEAFAQRGLNVFVLDRDATAAQQKARELQSTHGVQCEAIVADLGSTEAASRALAAVGDRELGMLVYNAALSDVGPFYKPGLGLDYELTRLNVNVVNPMQFVHHFARPMLRRGRGGIILMSSGSGLQGAPYYTHYGATKAYNIVLGEGLWEEFRHYGVDVLSLSAGLTSSPEIMKAVAQGHAKHGRFQTPKEVAEEAIGALGKGPLWVPGRHNRRFYLLQKLLPRRMIVQEIAKHAITNFLNGVRPAQHLD
ncbi:SDR family NAD(P)-dependent oxidoreductase [Archangium violaceum]|uniref:SDR family NAD(P)-dependent oxidoreductase n=1 Tax=Archangium violaceum TaxID=83451 RepID=UPI00193C7A2C|nr:SDR family NAD(P)-dependent oxidoreductase [Archangium violaceum]QRK05701.1 SDR family NAD(P)-dependent oxidoreductase [Archangium violaceum]